MTTAYQKLENCFKTLSDLTHAEHMLLWDEATMMPIGGGPARAQALATLKAIQHELLVNTETITLLESAKQQSNLSAWQQANLAWIERLIQKNTCLPVALVKAQTASSIESEQAWRRYRAENNWQDFLPYLEKTFQLVKESAQIRADHFGLSTYDILIDDYSPDVTQHDIDPIFNTLKRTLPPLIDAIINKQRNETTTIPQGPFDIQKQQALGKELMAAIGFDFNHGRLDTSDHPFCGGVPEDVRITTRYRDDEFTSALLGICHETGHALYEQSLPEQWRQQPVGQVLGMAVHESQSLIIEMDACRSQSFMNFLSKKLQHYFGTNPAFDANNLYRLHTRVKRSLIRVDADEVTYPLHVILCYDIEKDLFSGAINIHDLPAVWDAKMNDYLALSTKNNFKDGVLQDVHWPSGTFGYFPAYTLGRLMASQFFTTAIKQFPGITNNLSHGDFSQLKQWLNKNIHCFAASISYDDLLKTATQESLSPSYFIEHIKQRYNVILSV